MVINGDARHIPLSDGSVHLIITSPPYAVGKEYEEGLTPAQWPDFMATCLKEMYRVLDDSGRVCLNVATSLNNVEGWFFPMLLVLGPIEKSGLELKDIIIWDQCHSESNTAWGSWRSASCPSLRHQTEVIFLLYKGTWKRNKKGSTTIAPEQFTRWTLDVWKIASGSSRKGNHPAPFPEQLVERCIRLFSYREDTIFDPFVGSGTTVAVAKRLGRKGIGLDLKPEYCQLARRRERAEAWQMEIVH